MANENIGAFGERVTPVALRKRLSATFTRPSNTTAYTIGDVVGPVTTAAVQTLAGAARQNGGSGRITDVLLECNEPTITLGTFRIHIFNTSFTPAADNAAFAELHANAAYYQGFCDPPILVADFATASGAVTRLNAGIDAAKGLPMQFICAAGDTGLYAVIVALGAYVPKSAGVFRLSVIVEQD